MRRWAAIGGIFLIVVAISLPAQAGLGDLFDELLEDPVGDLTAPLAPLVTTLPLVPEVIETVDAVAAPVVEVVDVVASPVVTLVDETAGPLTEAVEDVLAPLVEPVVGELEPVTEVVDPVTEVVDPVVPTIPSTNLPPILDRPVVNTTSPTIPSVERPSVAVTSTAAPPAPAPVPPANQGVLLASIAAQPVSPVVFGDRGETRFTPSDPVIANNWLDALTTWLGSGVATLLDILAIPAHLLELLLRALTSAGSGLVAPAAILGALAVGGRRRLLPVK